MRTFTTPSFISTLVVTLLTGCGSGSDDTSSNSSPTQSQYLSGTFKHLDDSVLSREVAGEFFSYCSRTEQDRVFETERVIAWGASSLPDGDFQFAATAVDTQLTEALNNFNLSYADYLAKKPEIGRGFFSSVFTNNQLNNLIHDVNDGTIDEDWAREVLQLFQQNGLDTSLTNFVTDGDYRLTVINMKAEDAAKVQELVLENNAFYRINNERSLVPRKVVVCLDPQKDGVIWGEGTEIGIDIAPKSIASRPDEMQVIHHELIHHLETTWSNPIAGVPIVDRWMAEGAAVYFSGQQLHSGAPIANPTLVKGNIDENRHYADLGQAYKEYGQAFKYVVETYGVDAYFELLEAMRNNQEEYDRIWGMSETFIEEFSHHMSDYHTFTNDYPNLVK